MSKTKRTLELLQMYFECAAKGQTAPPADYAGAIREAFAEQEQIVGWWFHYPGDDTSADWVEFGSDKPSQDGHDGTVLVPIYTHPAPANQLTVLHEHALEEVLQLGYTVKDGRLYPPDAGIPQAPSHQALELGEKDGSPCPEFWDWLPKAYRLVGDGAWFSKYNMEMAFLAGKESAATCSQQAVGVPEGYAPIKTTITEEMHTAAVKVLHRATGVDSLPQRMLDAMLAAAPEAHVSTGHREIRSTVDTAPAPAQWQKDVK